MITIDIVSDTVCPWCFIGKRRLEKAMAARPGFDYQVSWRPFQLNPDMPEDGMARDQYLAMKFGGTQRAQQIYQNVSEAGELEGLKFRFDKILRQPNSLASHKLIRWSGSSGKQDAVVELLFQRYFVDGADIGDSEILLQVADAADMDAGLVRDLFDKGSDDELVLQEESVARRMGIAGVPCFIVAQKYAISGAQDPSVLINVFDLVVRGGDVADQAAEGRSGS